MRRLLMLSLATVALAACSNDQSDSAVASGAASDEASIAEVSDASGMASADASTAPSDATSATASASASATPSATPSQSASATPVAMASPPPSWGKCAICHNAAKGAGNKLGPNLYGVYGTKAAAIGDYDFSPALKASGLVWNDANLDKWLTSPLTMVPGTKMAFAGISDAAERKAIIAYLKAQR